MCSRFKPLKCACGGRLKMGAIIMAGDAALTVKIATPRYSGMLINFAPINNAKDILFHFMFTSVDDIINCIRTIRK